MKQKNTIVIIGLGDLAKRLSAAMLVNSAIDFDHLVIISRNKLVGQSYCRLLTGCSIKTVEFVELDCIDVDAVAKELQRLSPRLIIQNATLMSPWLLYERQDKNPQAKALLNCGFAAQLPAQLPVVIAVMRAIKQAGLSVPVINCSFPDVINPVLDRLGLTPTIGIGNSGMLHNLIRSQLKTNDVVRVFAHHAHVASVANCHLKAGLTEPVAFVGDSMIPLSDLLFQQAPILLNSELNLLTCAHALEIITALLPTSAQSLELRTSAPGPQGLMGGWPVRITAGKVSLDLPHGVAVDAMNDQQKQWMHHDGVEHIDDNGVIHFTEACMQGLTQLSPDLAQPLHPDFSLERLETINGLISG